LFTCHFICPSYPLNFILFLTRHCIFHCICQILPPIKHVILSSIVPALFPFFPNTSFLSANLTPYVEPHFIFHLINALRTSNRPIFSPYEYDRPGYGLAYIVSNTFEIAKYVSELSSEEIRFHLDLCHLCVALTRENRKSQKSSIILLMLPRMIYLIHQSKTFVITKFISLFKRNFPTYPPLNFLSLDWF
jgi:hypothetical protein